MDHSLLVRVVKTMVILKDGGHGCNKETRTFHFLVLHNSAVDKRKKDLIIFLALKRYLFTIRINSEDTERYLKRERVIDWLFIVIVNVKSPFTLISFRRKDSAAQ